MSELYKFSDDGTEVIITENKNKRTPLAWSNIMANKNFGTIVTEGMGGFTWYKNSQNGKITTFSNDPYVDKSSEFFIVTEYKSNKNNFNEENKDEIKQEKINKRTNTNQNIDNNKNKESYSLDVNNFPDNNEYITTFGIGYTKFEHETENIKTKLTIFVPIKNENQEKPEKNSILKIKNKLNKKQKIKIDYLVDFQLCENEKDKIVKETFDEKLNIFIAKGLDNNCYILCSEKMNSNKQIEIELNENEEKQISIIMQIEKSDLIENIDREKFNKYCNVKLKETKKYWKELTQKCTSKTPDKNFDIMQNSWLCYQTIASRLYAKAGFYQVSGALGFRDQMQDSICMKWVDENILKNQILINASHQFLEGDVMHWWHENKKIGIRTKYTDDMLFLPYGVIEYIKFTGDYSILDEKANYIVEKELRKDEKDRVINYKDKILEAKDSNTKELKINDSNILEDDKNLNKKIDENKLNYKNLGKDKKKLEKINSLNFSIMEHSIKAINRAYDFGEHGLPKIKGGDWNDGMNKIGEQGKGESVWLGFFLYFILDNFIPILKRYAKPEEDNKLKKLNFEIIEDSDKIDNELVKTKRNNKYKLENREIENKENSKIYDIKDIIAKYEAIKSELKNALENYIWDGEWFIRAIDDNGEIVGSKSSKECKIDNEVQAWATISKACDKQKCKTAMESVKKYLVDEKHNLVKLLTPPLEKVNLGYISSYPKGIRENGGQYSHAVIWDAIASCILNDYDNDSENKDNNENNSNNWNDKAYEFLKKVNPIEHANTKEKIEMYKVEPYVVPADIYSEGGLAGHGGWTWYTGTAGWMYELQTKYILGLNIENKIITLNPHIPSSWNEYKFTYRYKNAIYNFEVKRKTKMRSGEIPISKFKQKLKENGVYNFRIKSKII